MAANTAPIYSKAGNVARDNSTGMNQLITAAAADYTGVSGNYSLVFTAGADGSFIQRLRFKAGGTNVATVARVFINNGSTPGTAANNQFFGEITLPVTTASNVAATPDIDYHLNFAIPIGFRLYVGLATAVAAGWCVTTVGGNY